MDTVVRFILLLFGVWVGWRIITRRMRRRIARFDYSLEHEALEYHWEDGVRVITKSRPISVAPIPVTQYQVMGEILRSFFRQLRKHPRWMGRAILNVLRRPR